MSVFDKAKEAIRGLSGGINDVIKETFRQQQKLIVNYNAEEQLYKLGEDSKGSIIKPAYSRATVKLKRAKGQPINRVTLRDTGKFHKTLIVTPFEDYVEISSNISYSKYLLKKYGDNILGIQEELLKDFVKLYVLPKLKEEAKRKLEL